LVIVIVSLLPSFVSAKEIPVPAVSFESKKFGVVSFDDIETLTSVSAWIATQAEPLQTFNAPVDELKYNAPVAKAFPSLSTDGAEDLDPKYVSSKLSKDAAADVAELAAAVADDAAAVADEAASDALVVAVSLWPDAVEADEAEAVADDAEAVADEAAAVALSAADLASSNNAK